MPPRDHKKKQGGRRGDEKREPKEFEEEVLQIDRVTRVVKGGRRFRFRATVVIGNSKGKVGMGIGKSNEVVNAIQKAVSKAKKNLISVPLVNGTIPHDVEMQYGSAKMILRPASPGTGIIAGGAVRTVVKLVGIQNILSKVLGARNRITNAKAVILALQKLRARPQLDMPKTQHAAHAEGELIK